MARPSKSDYEIKAAQKEILAAARAIFAEGGLRSVTIRNVAAQIGCAPSSIYLSFQSRQDIVHAIWREVGAPLTRRLIAIERKVSEPLERLGLLLRAYADFAREYPEEFRITFLLSEAGSGEISGLDDVPSARHWDGYRTIYDAIAAGIATGVLRPMPLDLAAQSLWAAVHGVLALRVNLRRFPFVDLDSLVNHAIETHLSGMMADPSGREHPAPPKPARGRKNR